MKKKIILLTLAFFTLATNLTAVFAEETVRTEESTAVQEDILSTEQNVSGTTENEDAPSSNGELSVVDFKLFVNVKSASKNFSATTLRFNLFNEAGEWLSNQAVEVCETGLIEIVFPIGKYKVGSKFSLVATTGLDEYDYYGKIFHANEECVITTYAYRNENNELIICNEGYIVTTPITASDIFLKEKHVNDKKIWSNTPYLVWVSKANYTVNVFLKDNGRWSLIKEFPCSIGAPHTPTVTGQFVYHQYQTKWQYNDYYVGPIMRFYGGYALHSTLVNDDGSARDSRVGKMISHGCVRMRPDDITWLANMAPIGTKIYITNE